MGHTIRRLAAAGVTALALGAGCGDPAVKQGALQAGVAEAPLDIPVGTPLAGYTFRMLGISRPDRRDSPFAPVFPPSAGVHTPPSAKVIWLHNDDHHLVLVKIDVCYIADHVVEDVEDALSEQLDQDLHGQVMIAASHTHQGYGAWDAHLTYFLGGDQHHPEVDARLVHTITETAVAAWESREPAAIGMGWAVDSRAYQAGATLQNFPRNGWASGLSGRRTGRQEQVSGLGALYGYAWRTIAPRPR